MKITLLRHGKPSVDLAGYARARDLPRIARAYDEAGIIDSPPDDAKRLLSTHEVVMCSDLRRALESAQALGCGSTGIQSNPVFRETAIAHFDRGRILLPVQVWIIVLRTLWFAGFSKNGESFRAMKARARVASAELVALAGEHESVLLVGHGFLNRYIAVNLLAAGWRGPGGLNQRHWSYASYVYAPA